MMIKKIMNESAWRHNTSEGEGGWRSVLRGQKWRVEEVRGHPGQSHLLLLPWIYYRNYYTKFYRK